MKPPKRFEELDALRGIAALMVVFFHFTMGKPQADYGFYLGITGVDLFFIISGFVIFMSLTKVKNARQFIINRVSRLYPTYWACVTFTLLLMAGFSYYKFHDFRNIHPDQFLANMTMFQHYLGYEDLDAPYWTMIVEMVFYICVLFLYHFGLLRFLNKIGIVLSLLAVVLTSFFYDGFVSALLFYFPLMKFVPLFFAGTVFYKIYSEKGQLLRRYATLALCYACQLLLFKYVGKSSGYLTHIQYAAMLSAYFVLFILFVNGWLKFVISKPTLFLGKISFALYLVHQYLGFALVIPFLTKQLHVNFWIASFLVALPIVIAVASFITFYIELPLGKAMKQKLTKKLMPSAV